MNTVNISVTASNPWPVLASLRGAGTPACVLCMECLSPSHRQECLCYPGFPARRAEGKDNFLTPVTHWVEFAVRRG
jgi:hypothetical protein